MRSIRYFSLVMIGIALLVIVLAQRVGAHPEEYCVPAFEDWSQEAELRLSNRLMADLRGLRLRCPDLLDDQPGRGHYYGAATERWRGLVSAWWPADLVDFALCLIRYESQGKPGALNASGAAGLFQIMPGWWNGELPAKYRGDRFDPVTNSRAAYYIYDSQGRRAWSVVASGKC